MRLFAAIYPPPAAVAHLDAAVTELAAITAGRRVQPSARWHLTLAFLGEVADERADDAAGALLGAVAGTPELILRIAGGGHFGRGRFTVLWAGIGGDLAGLDALADRVRAGLRRARLPVDRKPFQAHLTLARPGDALPAGQLAADLSILGRYEGPQWSVTEVHLVRSIGGPQPSYESLYRAPR